MFAPVARRLALLNAVVVVAVVTISALVTFVLLRSGLDRQEEASLKARVAAAHLLWQDQLATGGPSTATATIRGDDDDHDEDESKDRDRRLLEGSDTILFAFDATGALRINEQDVSFPGLPAMDAVATALGGQANGTVVEIGDDRVRVWTEPVVVDGKLAGAVQGARGLAEVQHQRRLLLWLSLLGVGLGGLVAVPAGLFLARRAMRPIEAVFARQQAFVADASHEIRTPLAVIRANAELLRRLQSPSATDIAEGSGTILDEVDETSRLVDDLLLLARADEGAQLIELGEVDLFALAAGAVDAMRPRAEQLALDLGMAGAAPVIVEGDEARLRQVMRILLDNALRYTPAGGKVNVAVVNSADGGRFSVTDTGIGIAPADQSRVFDRFWRADKARTRALGGAGLGLPIARALIDAHGGKIGLESRLGRGTDVWFTIPRKTRGRHDPNSRTLRRAGTPEVRPDPALDDSR